MTDISVISGGIQVAKSGWAFLEYLRSVAGADVISAYFRYDGTRVEGSTKVEVELHAVEGQSSSGGFRSSHSATTRSFANL